ncbi:hypothetical protein J6590_050222 [Homalodisca vitripennis]|nr:hypothetical protein J6590_050220 [Homalodisca vitripennis]KAG8252741.1 hypothetical protein J6590_050222 [Homalodisca vitripennis]
MPKVKVREVLRYFGIIPTTPRHESLFDILLLLITRLAQRSKSSGLVDNVIAESRRPFSWCVALLYFLPPAEGASEARADVNERKTSLEIVSISKYNSRGADQKYKLNCNGKAIMYRAKNLNNHVMPRGLPTCSIEARVFGSDQKFYSRVQRVKLIIPTIPNFSLVPSGRKEKGVKDCRSLDTIIPHTLANLRSLP